MMLYENDTPIFFAVVVVTTKRVLILLHQQTPSRHQVILLIIICIHPYSKYKKIYRPDVRFPLNAHKVFNFLKHQVYI